MQNLPGLILSDASSESFALAVVETVIAIMFPLTKEAVLSVTIVSITANRRMLLSGVTVTYIVNITSTKAPEFFMGALQESVSSGTFASLLSVKSGLVIRRTSIYVVSFFPPTASSFKFTSKSGEELLTEMET